MAATITSKSTTAHSAAIPWADVMAAINTEAPTFLALQPALSVTGGGGGIAGIGGIGAGGVLSGLSFAWALTPQQLDQILRVSLPTLPTLGLYTVVVTANDTVNALTVNWTEQAVTLPPA